MARVYSGARARDTNCVCACVAYHLVAFRDNEQSDSRQNIAVARDSQKRRAAHPSRLYVWPVECVALVLSGQEYRDEEAKRRTNYKRSFQERLSKAKALEPRAECAPGLSLGRAESHCSQSLRPCRVRLDSTRHAVAVSRAPRAMRVSFDADLNCSLKQQS